MAYTFKHGDRPVEGYTIQRAVGKGGFGEVYYAISDGGREVAIKYLRDNPQVELRGVSNCINLKSPHLVSIFDVKKTTDDEYVIVMEYCSGPSLRDLLIAEPDGFEAQKAAFFVREIGKGLAYLHDRGIVHRDLKPGNIFYDDGYVKIGDYGLSKFISVSRHSGQTASVGTVHYMAPEIGSGSYSRGIDIYALGVILYEMLLGKVPFEGSTMAEVLMKHLTTQPEVDHLPHPFARVIRKALEKDPNDRYQTIEEMVDELLEVKEVRESLAGFGPQSLEGAVRRGATDRADSPVPSPYPTPERARDFARPGAGAYGQPPYAHPVGPSAALPDRVAKKMDRVSRKMEAKMAKLGGRRPRQAPPPPPPPGAARPGGAPGAPPIPLAERKKRMLLSGLLSIGLAIGLGVLIGNAFEEEVGASAGMLVVAMSGGILLSRKAIRWFGVEYGPRWPQRLIQACCCAPLTAIGAAPLFESHRYSDEGVAVYLGLLILAASARWNKALEKASTGEMSFGSALWTAVWALICTLVTTGIFCGEPNEFVFISAGVAGAVSLIIQATSWWLPARTAGPFQQFGSGPRAEWEAGRAAPPPPHPAAPPAYGEPVGQHMPEPVTPTGEAAAYTAAADQTQQQRVRWGITRAFWGIIAFVLMGGVIVTFLYALIAGNAPHGDITGCIVVCTGCFSFMIFALRKTTPLRRDGFWRETLRPFLIALTMFGIGGTITGIAREWNYVSQCGSCLDDGAKVALVAGLAMCSLLFLGLTLFTGRRRHARRHASKPFVLVDVGRGDRGGYGCASYCEVIDEAPASDDVPPPDRRADDVAVAHRAPAESVRPHRGVTVLVLGILGINLFPLGIAAWVMGHHDLLDMDAGRMDPSGRGITAAGKICGMIGALLACLGLIGGLTVALLAGLGVIH